jgi:hypothetical protein
MGVYLLFLAVKATLFLPVGSRMAAVVLSQADDLGGPPFLKVLLLSGPAEGSEGDDPQQA